MMKVIYVALLWMWLQMLQIDASDYKDAGNYRKTPLTQCCQDDELYRPGLDRCLSRVNHFEQKTNDSLLYAVEDNNTFLVGASEFHLSYNLAACRTGYVATTTTEFQIFANGSLRVENTLFPPYQYCTNEVPSSDSSTIEFIARYCIPDPCAQDDIHCLRKCCPQGQAIDVPTQSCQPHPTSFNVSQMLKSNGGPIDVEDEEFLTLQFGLGFQCYNDDIIQVDDFGISSKGLLTSHDYVYFAARQRSHDHPTDQYCIDNFVNHNASKLSALRCYPTLPKSSEHRIRFSVAYPYLLFLTALFLIATFITYALLPGLRNKSGVSVMCYVFSMFVYYMGQGVIHMALRMPKEICISLPVLVHFSCLATFSWLNVLCCDLWWTIREKTEDLNLNRARSNRLLAYYSIYGWGVPLLIVAVGQILEHVKILPGRVITPGFEESHCWFINENRPPLFAYLYGPMALMFIGNIMFIFLTISTLCKNISSGDSNNIKRPSLSFRVIIGLFLLTGTIWITESVTFFVEESALTWVITDILNILSGLIIFVIFICKKAVWQLLLERCKCSSYRRRNVYNPRTNRKSVVSSSMSEAACRFMPYNSQRLEPCRIVGELILGSPVNSTASSSFGSRETVLIEPRHSSRRTPRPNPRKMGVVW